MGLLLDSCIAFVLFVRGSSNKIGMDCSCDTTGIAPYFCRISPSSHSLSNLHDPSGMIFAPLQSDRCGHGDVGGMPSTKPTVDEDDNNLPGLDENGWGS